MNAHPIGASGEGAGGRLRGRAARLAALLVVAAGCATTSDTARIPGFVLGADISALDAPERHGRGFPHSYQEDGVPSDELALLRRHGWTAFRLRVFVAPVREAPNNTLEAAIPLALRIKASHSTFLLDIHLSDTWADPQHQEIPVAWRGLGVDALVQRVEAYTYDVVKRFKEAGAMPDWVQVGNEVTRGTLWPIAKLGDPGSDEAVQWDHLTRVLKAGIRGVMRASGDTPPRIALHIDKGASWPATERFFDHMNAAGVPYDIIAESFYPEWNHGTLDQLWDNMNRCAQKFGKDFLVVETGYGRSHVPDNPSMLWPETPEGRLQFMADIINTVRKAPHGIGVMYWAPEWEAWNKDGSPGPVVYVMDHLKDLTARPASHAPAAVNP